MNTYYISYRYIAMLSIIGSVIVTLITYSIATR
jgi:hypothetical protein